MAASLCQMERHKPVRNQGQPADLRGEVDPGTLSILVNRGGRGLASSMGNDGSHSMAQTKERYVSGYRRSRSHHQLEIKLQLTLILLPTVFMLLPYVTEPNPEERRGLGNALLVVYPVILALMAISWRAFRAARRLVVDIDDEGIHHLAPGKPRSLAWRDLIKADIVQVGNGMRGVRVKSRSASYVLQPQLVPESPEAPVLDVSKRGIRWLYPDGRAEPSELPWLHAFRVVERHRPDLLVTQGRG